MNTILSNCILPANPAVVHFPIVLAVLLPIAAASAIFAIRRNAPRRPTWIPVVGIAAALTLSSWIAVETGHDEEEAVENIVPASALHDHEKRVEVFFPMTVVVLLIVSAGLSKGQAGNVFRVVAVVGALGLMILGLRVGNSGGELVYVHGAAGAYSDPGSGQGGDRGSGEEEEGRR